MSLKNIILTNVPMMSLTLTDNEMANTEIDLVHIKCTIYLVKLESIKIRKLLIIMNTFYVDCY